MGCQVDTRRLETKENLSQVFEEFQPDVIVAPAKSIKILVLEDIDFDAELEIRELLKAGIAPDARVVKTREDFIRELDQFKPDIVISDYSLPEFDGRAAVEIVRQKNPYIPVILVTGVLSDDDAVKLFKSGITDYVLKDRLARLGPAVLLLRPKSRKSDAARQPGWRRDKFARIAESARCGVIGISAAGIIMRWNAAQNGFTG